MGRARAWHLLTFVVATFAVVLQLVLVWQGHNVLDETNRPDLDTRLVRFVRNFTILSNALVAVTTGALALGHDLAGRTWRVLRLNAVVSIAVTGLVHWFLLRPLLDLDGADYWADKLLHVIVPLLAVAGWLLFGPRARVSRTDLVPSAIYPGLYMVYTLPGGAGRGARLIVLLVVLSLGALALDRRLPGEGA